FLFHHSAWRGRARQARRPRSLALQPASNGFPCAIESSRNLHRWRIELATKVHPTVVTVRDYRAPSGTMSDNDDRARGSGAAVEARRPVQVPSLRFEVALP